MRLPIWIIALGFLGLVPFLAAPFVLAFAPQSAPGWLDQVWLGYLVLIAAFLAGSFWGVSVLLSAGSAGAIGVVIASMLTLLAGVALLLPLHAALYLLALVFMLLLLADYWRERTQDSIPGYFVLRTTLTAGVVIAIGWRIALL